MRTYKLIFLALIISLSCDLNSQHIDFDQPVEDWIETMSAKLDAIANRGLNRFDVITYERIEQVNVLLQNLEIELSKDLEKALREVAGFRQTFVSLTDLIEGGIEAFERSQLEIDLIVNTSMADICYNLPKLVCNINQFNYAFSYVKNQTLIYDPARAYYEVEVGGASISVDKETTLVIGDERIVGINNEASQRNKAVFRIESDVLNKYFKEYKNNEIEIKIESIVPVKQSRIRRWLTGEKTKVVGLETRLFLLPIYPFKFEAVERFHPVDWEKKRKVSKNFTSNASDLNNWFNFNLSKNERFSRYISHKELKYNVSDDVLDTKYDQYLFGIYEEPFFENDRKTVKFLGRDLFSRNGEVLSYGVTRDHLLKRRILKAKYYVFKDDEQKTASANSYFKYLLSKHKQDLFNPDIFPFRHITLGGRKFIITIEIADKGVNKNKLIEQVMQIDPSQTTGNYKDGYLGFGDFYFIADQSIENFHSFTFTITPLFLGGKSEKKISLTELNTRQKVDRINLSLSSSKGYHRLSITN